MTAQPHLSPYLSVPPSLPSAAVRLSVCVSRSRKHLVIKIPWAAATKYQHAHTGVKRTRHNERGDQGSVNAMRFLK